MSTGLLQDSRRLSECRNTGGSGSRNGGIECGCSCSVFTTTCHRMANSFPSVKLVTIVALGRIHYIRLHVFGDRILVTEERLNRWR
jgi:hypothetical protein